MTFSLAVWITVCLANAVAFAATFKRGVDRGLLWLRWYFFFAVAANVGVHLTLVEFGFKSKQYMYAYFLTDLVIVILGYVVLSRLVELAFEKSSLKLQGLRTGAILLFTGLAAISAYFVYAERGHLVAPLVAVEMEQNFSFLGMLLAIVLFVGMNLMQVQGIRFRRVVLAFSLLYSSGAIAYAVAAVLPNIGPAIGVYIVPVTSLAGIGLIAYSLWVPEPERRSRPLGAELAFREARGATW